MHHHHVKTVWDQDMAFDSHLGKHVVRIDGHPDEAEKSGTGPKALMLTALTGCTAMDVVSLLNKMHMPFDTFNVEASADLTDEHPKVYKEINLVFNFTGPELSEEKINKSVRLSMERYCGVSAMLRAHCPVNWEIKMN